MEQEGGATLMKERFTQTALAVAFGVAAYRIWADGVARALGSGQVLPATAVLVLGGGTLAAYVMIGLLIGRNWTPRT
jgi:hypothetical protein